MTEAVCGVTTPSATAAAPCPKGDIMDYEAPSIIEIGTVRGLTLGMDTLREWEDEVYFYGWRLPAPGSGLS